MVVEVPLEVVEAAGPQQAVGLEPVVELDEGGGPQAVEPAVGIGAYVHEAGLPQHLQLLGDGGLGQPDGVDDRTGRLLAVAQEVEDRPPPRLGQCREYRHNRILLADDSAVNLSLEKVIP